MGKCILGGIILVVVIVIGFYLYDANTVAYVATVDDEVAQLETELAGLDAAIAAGELTPDEANAARTGILNRLGIINRSVDSAERAQLTEAQKQQLLGALDRLKGILTTYRATLTTVEEESKKSSRRRSGSGGNRSVVDVVDETIGNLEEHVDEVVEDYEPEEENIEEGEEMNDEEDTMDDEEEMEDEDSDTATSTDDGTATTTDSDAGGEEITQ